MTDMALEMLGFLVLDQNFLVFKLSLAIKTPNLERLLLLLPHFTRAKVAGSPEVLSKVPPKMSITG